MARSRRLEKYPPGFFELVKAFERDGSLELPLPPEQLWHIRGELYGFFGALNREAHPLAQVVNRCILRVKGCSLWFEGPETHPSAPFIDEALRKAGIKTEAQKSQEKLMTLLRQGGADGQGDSAVARDSAKASREEGAADKGRVVLSKDNAESAGMGSSDADAIRRAFADRAAADNARLHNDETGGSG